jgi:hypothetical protein
MSYQEAQELRGDPLARGFIRRFVGSREAINGLLRYCLWIRDEDVALAKASATISARLGLVEKERQASNATSTRDFAHRSHRFVQIAGVSKLNAIVVPAVSSESREYLPVEYMTADTIVSNLAFALYDAPLWNMALVASKIHLIWIATVCGKMKTDFRYSNTLGWNTFPVPPLTDQDKIDLTRCAENILLAREAHFPSTIADLYASETMPANLRAAHEANDETLERIYIGRRFKNDTERLEKLFGMYTKMTSKQAGISGQGSVRKSKKQVTA